MPPRLSWGEPAPAFTPVRYVIGCTREWNHAHGPPEFWGIQSSRGDGAEGRPPDRRCRPGWRLERSQSLGQRTREHQNSGGQAAQDSSASCRSGYQRLNTAPRSPLRVLTPFGQKTQTHRSQGVSGSIIDHSRLAYHGAMANPHDRVLAASRHVCRLCHEQIREGSFSSPQKIV